MKKNVNAQWLVYLSPLIFLWHSCDDVKPCVNLDYSFNGSFAVWPQKNVFSVGDTIVFRAVAPKCGFEFRSQSVRCVERIVDPVFNCFFRQFDSITNNNFINLKGAVNSFSIQPLRGSIYNSPNSTNSLERLNIRMADSIRQMSSTVQIICKTPGYYNLGVTSAAAHHQLHLCQLTTFDLNPVFPTNEVLQALGNAMANTSIVQSRVGYFIRVMP